MIAMDPVLGHVIALALAVLFLWSCGHKLRAPRAFKAALRDYRLLPAVLAGPAGTVLIAAEALAGAGALLVDARSFALLLMLSLLALYTSAIAVNLLRGRRGIDCGCGPVARDQPLSLGLVARNLALMALAALALLPSSGRRLDWLDIVTIATGTAVCALLYGATAQLAANRPRLAALRKPNV
jgi:hypothetical protein